MGRNSSHGHGDGHRGGRQPGHPPRPSPRGFSQPGYRQLFGHLMPGLRGPEKREHLNQVSTGIVVAAGLVGAGLGGSAFGWIGGLVGLGLGVSMGGSFVERQRYHRD